MPIIQKIRQYAEIARAYIWQLRDVRFAGQVLFIVVVLLVSWSGVKSIDTNYELQKQITALDEQNTLQQLENNNAKLQNQYYNSNQYLELMARQDFGLAAPGEKEILVPQSVALSYTLPEPKLPTSAQNSTQSFYARNLNDWLNFFLHRQSGAN